MHDNTTYGLKNYDKIENKKYICSGIIWETAFIYKKINLKKLLSRGSRFKIYFRLERRGNRGSRLNFHGILFSKTAY